eukprot:CAMPEP_0119300934 /NCGR_PEP_ID=MMETSP1333-20130426/2818_1 /TAXON_ID=418940 /ORGANISM="Scyphosphaera apsteinii, Strain RCC1455" /LENGTH=162 /DNA_ID=CAMNT_0007302873 /DNA_START=371 /DNA_END=856 /DNA_ORIENTATION=+
MVARDTSYLAYDLLIRTLPRQPVSRKGKRATGLYGDAHWKTGTREKVRWVNEVLAQYKRAPEIIWLITDLDVMPLRPYSHLVTWFVRQPHEIVFMREPGHSLGLGGVKWVANTGFILLRNTPRVRDFVGHWYFRVRVNRKLLEQDLANWLLVKHVGHRELNW